MAETRIEQRVVAILVYLYYKLNFHASLCFGISTTHDE